MQTWRIQVLDEVKKAVRFSLLFALVSLLPAIGFAAPPPVITAQPLDQTVVYGGTATFTVAATSGTALSYQWYKDGSLVLGELLVGRTASSLTLTNVSDSDVGQYFVQVMNAGGTTTSRKATLSVVTNTPPVASPDYYSTMEDTMLVVPVSGLLTNDTDINGQTLSAVLMTNVTQGSLTLSTSGAFSYMPPTNYSGLVSFTYRTSDGYPVLLEQNNTNGGSSRINSGDTGAQSFRHVSTPGSGSTYMINQVVLYLSRKGGSGGNLKVSLGTAIGSGNIANSVKNISASSITNTTEGTSFQTNVVVFNPPVGPFNVGTTYYLNLANNTDDKVYVETATTNTYTAGTYYDRGSDLGKDLRFQLYETILSNPATVSISVLPVEDPPTVGNDTTNTLEDTSVTIKVLANDYDPEGLPLTLTGVTTTNGTALISGTNILFTPAQNYFGTVILNYTVSDGGLVSTGRVTVTVTSVNDAPIATSDTYTTPANTALTVTAPGLLANDTDVDSTALTAVLMSKTTHGTLTLNPDGSFTYTPDADYYGTDAFTYRTSDGSAVGNTATVTLTVTRTPDPLKITSGEMTEKGFRLQLTGPDDTTYIILASTNATDWTTIATSRVTTGGLVFTDTEAAKYPMRFYRAQLLNTKVIPAGLQP